MNVLQFFLGSPDHPEGHLRHLPNLSWFTLTHLNYERGEFMPPDARQFNSALDYPYVSTPNKKKKMEFKSISSSPPTTKGILEGLYLS